MSQEKNGQETSLQEGSPLDQTLIEILSSLSEKSNPKINDPLDLKPDRPGERQPQEATSDDDQVTTFYDKSLSMNAPKPTQVP